jgi:hypothetical protein
MKYSKDNLPALKMKEYRKTAITQAVEMPCDFEVETLEGTMKGKKGDFLCLDNGGNPYPCARHIFLASYTPLRTDTIERDVAVNSYKSERRTYVEPW